MKQVIVLTIVAPDQTGIVERLSSILKNHGGNWQRSSMSRLAGQFAGILEGSVPTEHFKACIAELNGLEGEGLQVVAQHGAPDENFGQEEYRLELVGNDTAGILANVAAVLSARAVNVNGLETVVESASMAGGDIFRAYARLMLPEGLDPEELAVDLENLADDLMVDISFES